MEKEGLRVKLNLTEFFSDARKYTYIFIEPKVIKNFYDLEKRIRNDFEIPGNIIFLIENVYVPHSESIKLIHDDETLTLSANAAVGINRLVGTESTEFHGTLCKKYEVKRKKKKYVHHPNEENYPKITSERGFVRVPKKKKKVDVYPIDCCEIPESVASINMDPDSIKSDCEVVEIEDTENMILKGDKLFNFSTLNFEDIDRTPINNKRKNILNTNEKDKENLILVKDEANAINCESEERKPNDESEYKRGTSISFYNSDNIDESINYFKDKNSLRQNQDLSRKTARTYISESMKLSFGKDDRIADQSEMNVDMPNIEACGDDHSVYNKSVAKPRKSNYKSNNEYGTSEKGGNYCLPNINAEDKKLLPISYMKDENTELGIDQSMMDPNVNLFDNDDDTIKSKRTNITDGLNNKSYYSNEEDLIINNISYPVHLDNIVGKKGKRKLKKKHIKVLKRRQEKKVTKETKPKANHVRFNDENSREYIIEVSDEDNDTRSHLQLSDNVSPSLTKSEVFLARNVTPIPVDTFRKLLFLGENSSSPIVLNETTTHLDSTKETEMNSHVNEVSETSDGCEIEDINLEKYPLLNSSPRKSDILAFKLYRMTSDYSLCLTEYIIAEVVKYCKHTANITVKVKRFYLGKCCQHKVFFLPMDGSLLEALLQLFVNGPDFLQEIPFPQVTCVPLRGGLEQLEEPMRRSSLSDDFEEISVPNDIFEYNWNELRETRILYP